MAAKVKSRSHWLRQCIRSIRSRIARRRLKNTCIIAVTGSCGKTTACILLDQILSSQHPCFNGSEFNDLNSVVRHLRKVKTSDRYLVQETTGHCPGYLKKTLTLLKPQIGIVTTVGLDHFRSFRKIEAVAKEKSTMAALLPPDGCAVLNLDDPHVAAMASLSPARVITYGINPSADLRATDIECAWPQRLTMTLNYQGESVRVETQLFGQLLLPSLLAAVGGALAAGLSLQDCTASLQGQQALNHRMSIHRSPLGPWFISDTLKASYWTITKVLDQLTGARAPRVTAVLGSFSDIPGSDSDKYRRIANYALGLADRVIFTGPKSAYVEKLITPERSGRLFTFVEPEDAAKYLNATAIPDELILIKTSKIDHLERLIYHQQYKIQCWISECRLKTLDCQFCVKSGVPGATRTC